MWSGTRAEIPQAISVSRHRSPWSSVPTRKDIGEGGGCPKAHRAGRVLGRETQWRRPSDLSCDRVLAASRHFIGTVGRLVGLASRATIHSLSATAPGASIEPFVRLVWVLRAAAGRAAEIRLVAPRKGPRHLHPPTEVALDVRMVAAPAKRSMLPFNPKFAGDPVSRFTIVAKTPCASPAIHARPVKDGGVIGRADNLQLFVLPCRHEADGSRAERERERPTGEGA